MKLLLFGSWEEIWVPGWGRGMQAGDPALLKESAWLHEAGDRAPSPGEGRGPPGLLRRAPGSRLHAAGIVTDCREGLGNVSHSPPEVKGHRAAEPVGALQARRAAAPRGSEPAANASLAAPPPPAGPTLATRLPPPGSDAPSSPLGAAASPGRPFRRPVKGAQGPAGWSGLGVGCGPNPVLPYS